MLEWKDVDFRVANVLSISTLEAFEIEHQSSMIGGFFHVATIAAATNEVTSYSPYFVDGPSLVVMFKGNLHDGHGLNYPL